MDSGQGARAKLLDTSLKSEDGDLFPGGKHSFFF